MNARDGMLDWLDDLAWAVRQITNQGVVLVYVGGECGAWADYVRNGRK
jgi:hypothetical protein